jgi:protein involved in polysaccharide export with SLBB domain
MKILLFLFAAMAFAQTPALPPSYVLGPDDQVVIHVLDSDEIGASPFRIDMRGYINVPLAGQIHAAGLSVEQLEAGRAAPRR